MKNKLLSSFLILVLPLISVIGQVPPPPEQGEDAFTPGAPNTPVDQYVFILPLIAIAIVAYFVWNQRKKLA